jgi:hypothetical protein
MSLLKELLLIEATKPTDVATANPTATDDIFSRDFHSPAASRDNSPAGRKKTRGGLRAAIAAASADGSMADAPRMNHDAMNDLPDDDDQNLSDGDNTDPKEPGNDVANVETGVRAAGKAKANWMGVDQLPGYMQTGIRRMGRVVFSPLTKTRLEDMSIIANLGGHGPNKQMELDAVAKYAQSNATQTRDLAMSFGDMIPGYEPDAKVYVTPHDTYLVVQDEMGRYIYSWESKDTKDAFVKSIDDGSSPKSLE